MPLSRENFLWTVEGSVFPAVGASNAAGTKRPRKVEDDFNPMEARMLDKLVATANETVLVQHQLEQTKSRVLESA